MDSEEDDRRKHLRALVMMALADGSIGEREVNLVADRCVSLGLSVEDLHDALRTGLSGTASIDPPESAEDRRELLKDLIRVMAADAHLAEPEKQMFALVAARLGLTGEDVSGLVAEVTAETDAGA